MKKSLKLSMIIIGILFIGGLTYFYGNYEPMPTNEIHHYQINVSDNLKIDDKKTGFP